MAAKYALNVTPANYCLTTDTFIFMFNLFIFWLAESGKKTISSDWNRFFRLKTKIEFWVTSNGRLVTIECCMNGRLLDTQSANIYLVWVEYLNLLKIPRLTGILLCFGFTYGMSNNKEPRSYGNFEFIKGCGRRNQKLSTCKMQEGVRKAITTSRTTYVRNIWVVFTILVKFLIAFHVRHKVYSRPPQKTKIIV